MKILKYVKWLLVSLAIVTFISCGGSSDSGDKLTVEESKVKLSYPEDDNVLVRFEQTNGDAQGEYTRENKDGESELSGTVDSTKFSITYIDELPNEIVVGSSNATFTYNGDNTFNYKIYIDGELMAEEYSVILSSLAPSSMARTIRRTSKEKCQQKKEDIALLYKIFAQRVLILKLNEIEDHEDCFNDPYYDSKYCDDEYPVSDFKSIMADIFLQVKTFAILLDDYKKSCSKTETDDDSDTTSLSYYKPTQAACESAGGEWDIIDECMADWNEAVSICEIPSIDMWTDIITGCGAVLNDTVANSDNNVYEQCYKDLGYTKAAYWSSSTDEDNVDDAWIANLRNGYTFTYYKDYRYAYMVRCVR